MTNKTPYILAEVILKSKSGRSMVSSDDNITSENIEEFQPSQQVVKDATDRLKKLGFTVVSGGITLTIKGEKALFEKVFKVNLTLKKNGLTGKIEVHSDKQLSVPAEISDIVESIIFTPPVKFFS
jgi:subtilase family serine protease